MIKNWTPDNDRVSDRDRARNHSRNVKRWRDGDMRLRWAAAGMLAAAGQFRRVKGYTQLPALAAAIRRQITGDTPTQTTETVSA